MQNISELPEMLCRKTYALEELIQEKLDQDGSENEEIKLVED